MSNISNAVVAGLRITGTGSGGDGICSVCGGLVMGITRLRQCRPAYHYGSFFEARRKKSWMPSAGISAFIISLYHLLPLLT